MMSRSAVLPHLQWEIGDSVSFPLWMGPAIYFMFGFVSSDKTDDFSKTAFSIFLLFTLTVIELEEFKFASLRVIQHF